MLKNENYGIFADLMLSDIMNERKHLLFYLTAASTVSGPHREEYKELFEKEAAGEMQHVIQFQNVLLGLGVDLTASTKTTEHNAYIVSYD